MDPSEPGTATPQAAPGAAARAREAAASTWALPDAAGAGRVLPPRPGPAQPHRPVAPPAYRGPYPPPGATPPGGPPRTPPAWPPRNLAGPPPMRTPSGLFPAGPPRPVYREPLPVRPGAASLGALAGAVWMLLFGAVATSARGYAWATLVAGVLAWGVALLLVRYGDRGTGVGVALSAGVGLSVAGVVVTNQLMHGHWVLW